MRSRLGLLLALATLAAVPSSAVGFAGEDFLRKGDDETMTSVNNYHHQKLTYDAAVEAIGVAPAVGRRLAWHADYIDSYLYSPLWWLKDPSNKFQRFRRALTIASELEKLHFDDLNFNTQVARTWDRYTTGAFASLVHFAERGDVEAARNVLAVSAHALEDFYSHSNWIDLPVLRDKTWFDLTPQQRASLKLYAGQYEALNPTVKPHGKINVGCIVMCLPVVKATIGRICNLGLLPMGDSKLCKLYRECADKNTQPVGGVKAAGITIPSSMIYYGPPGIAVDTTWMSPIGTAVRGIKFEDPNGPDVQPNPPTGPDAAFRTAYALALKSTKQWFVRLQTEMRQAGFGDFWERVKNEAPGPFSARQFQYEHMGQVPYQFMSAGKYPTPTPAQTESWYVRLKLKTSNGLGGGTDADIIANVDGKKTLLDYRGKARKEDSKGNVVSSTPNDLAKSPLLQYNDFEAGDHDVYTVGPFATPPSSLILENRAGNVGNVFEAIGNSFIASVEHLGKKIEDLFVGLIGGNADYIAEKKVTFEYLGGSGADRNLAKAAKNPAGTDFTMFLNGGGEGKHRLYGNIRRVSEGFNEQLGVFDEFEIWIKRGVAVKESVNDRGSDSDEPFFAFVYTPLAPGAGQTLGPVSLFNDVDTGESYTFASAGQPSQRFRFKVPRETGMILLSVAAFESDDESAKTRKGLRNDFAGILKKATKDEREDFLTATGKLLYSDWGLERVEAYTFNRASGVTPLRSGVTLDTMVNRRISSNTSIPFSLNPGAMQQRPTNAEELQTRVVEFSFG